MKQILIVAFVFALGILMLLAEKSPQLEERRVPALNDDAYHAALLKRGVGKHTSGLCDSFNREKNFRSM